MQEHGLNNRENKRSSLNEQKKKSDKEISVRSHYWMQELLE